MKNKKAAKKALPCGTWPSHLSSKDAAGSSVGLSNLSADGETLYWLEGRPNEQGRTALVRKLSNESIEEVTPPPINVASRVHEYGGGAYAVSSGRIVYSEKNDGSLWLIEGDKLPRKITAVKDCRYTDFRFVPGTNNVVCVREDHRNRPPTDPEAAIVMLETDKNISPDKNEGTVLIKGPDFLSSPRPSPDGKKIAWISWEHPDMPWDTTKLHTADLLSGKIKNDRVLAGEEHSKFIIQPEWSPNGVLYFCSDLTDWWNLFCIGAKGKAEPVTTIPDGEIGGPHWTFGQRYFDFLPGGNIIANIARNGKSQCISIDGNGTMRPIRLPPASGCPISLPNSEGFDLAYISMAQDTMPAIEVSSKNKGATKSITLRKSGPEVLCKDDISVCKEISFPTGDGETAHAFYYPPKNSVFKPSKNEKPPLIIMIHGGPTSIANSGFSPRVQWWTNRGFAVADINYRGSTGYGRAYRQKLNGNWGITDVEDCVAAVRFLTIKGLADSDRVAIRGGSAGGFTVLAALTSSDVFKAGASHYGVADLMLLAKETHKFEARYLDRLLGPLPQASHIYHDRSPINHLNKMKAGTIFFQGLDDKVVPPSQAKTMVKAMQDRNLPVAHFEFKGEGHGFRQADTKRRVLELELAFYGKLFGFTPPGLTETVGVAGLDKKLQKGAGTLAP